jgi:hypothetical protein
MITAKSLINETITLIIDNGKQIITAKSDHPRWLSIRDAFAAGNDALLESLVSIKAVIENYSVGKLSVNSAGVTYNGRPMHTVDSNRVMAFLKNGIDYQPIANYIEKKAKNPSKRAIEEMYNFLENKFMPLTPSGTFIAYRGVNDDYWSKTGNLETVVIQGEVNAAGQILNKIGATIEIERSSCDDDKSRDCAPGLHIGSLEYAKAWASRVILVEVDPADVISIPENSGCAKMRCCKYKIIGEFSYPLNDIYDDEHTTKPVTAEKSKFANDSHLKMQRDSSGRFIKIDGEVKFESYDEMNAPKIFKDTIDESDVETLDCCENPNCEGHKLFTNFELGYNDGRHDMLHGHNPRYISSDILGSDYIEGYVDGFDSLPI